MRFGFISTVIALVCSIWFVDAYRVGDLVDAVISTRSMTTIELLLSSRPLFGVPKTIQLARLSERFSMRFEEGLHSLPFVDGQTLEKLIVTFVYSKSGEGRIHSVTSKAIRTDGGSARIAAMGDREQKKPIDVSFEWVEEEAVDLSSGTSIMFLAVMMASVIFLIQLCSIDSDRDDVGGQKFVNNNRRKLTSVGYANAGGSRYKHQE